MRYQLLAATRGTTTVRERKSRRRRRRREEVLQNFFFPPKKTEADQLDPRRKQTRPLEESNAWVEKGAYPIWRLCGLAWAETFLWFHGADLEPSQAWRCEWAMPCGNGQTLSKRKHGVCVPRFSFCSFLFVALWCLEARGSGPPGPGARSCSPCPANCSCVPAAGPRQSCVVNCTSIGLERAPAAADIPLATSVL